MLWLNESNRVKPVLVIYRVDFSDHSLRMVATPEVSKRERVEGPFGALYHGNALPQRITALIWFANSDQPPQVAVWDGIRVWDQPLNSVPPKP